MVRRFLPLAMLFIGGAFLVPGSAPADGRAGGILRVKTNQFDYVDPALAYRKGSWAVLDTTCARLMNYADKPLPEGFRLVPEVAAREPDISDGGKTFTFTLRSGFRFSDGKPVRADAFARAISRSLAPGLETAASAYTREIVGAADFSEGKTQKLAGVVVRGNQLTVRFTRPVLDFPAQSTMPFFCAVPPTLHSDPEGVGAFPGSGPYYVAEYRPGERVRVRRNPYYRGARPHHVEGFDVDVRAASDGDILDDVEAGAVDYGILDGPTAYLNPARRLVAKYEKNESRFFIRAGLGFRGYAFNTSRPLFSDNAKLRQAVSFAVDRRAIRRVLGGPLAAYLTDQYLPPAMPGFRNAALYPQRPNLQRAQTLARGNARSGKVALYAFDVPPAVAAAQVIKGNLAAIGLEAEITRVPPLALFDRLAKPDEPWDLATFGWLPDYIDPFQYMNALFDGRFAAQSNVSRFKSRRFDAALRRASSLRGPARYRAYGDIDLQLARDAVPLLPISFTNEFTLVSRRVSCVVLRPALDLTAACIK